MTYSTLVEERLRFLAYDESTAATLREARAPLEVAMDELLDKFYDHILGQPELKRLFSDDEAVSRARNAQKEHWLKTLFSEDFGKAQFDRAERIGQAHVRVGLMPSWYLDGYCFMLNQFIQVISEHCGNDTQRLSRIVQALNKAVFLDVNFVIDSYLETKNDAMNQILLRATTLAEDVQGLGRNIGESALEVQARADKLVGRLQAPRDGVDEIEAARDEVHEILVSSSRLCDRISHLNSRVDNLMHGDRLYRSRDRHRGILSGVRSFLERFRTD